jgi:hypothetical protein
MPYVKLPSEKNKFSKYRGSGFIRTHSRLPFIPLNNHQIYLTRQGGFIDLSSIINAGKTIVDTVKDNKDLIQSGISTVKSISDTATAIADTIKKSKELDQIKQIKAINKSKKKQDVEMSPEQMAILEKIGDGFKKF